MMKFKSLNLVLLIVALVWSLAAVAQSSDRAPEAASPAAPVTAAAPVASGDVAPAALAAPTPAAAPSADVKSALAPTLIAKSPHVRSADVRAAIAPAAAPTVLLAQAATPAVAPSADVKSSPTPEAKPVPELPHYFHFDFAVKEVDEGKVTNSRTYTMVMAVRRPGYEKRAQSSLRSGNRIPVITGKSDSAGASAQYQYIDVGVNIDVVSPIESQGQLMMEVRADVSNVPGGVDTNTPNPVIRQARWESAVVVPIGKPTTIFSSDDVSSKRTLQLELTATPIK
jgi:hypothetical protein